MTDFNLKLTPKAKEEISSFKNFHLLPGARFGDFNGKVVYLNSSYPDKHIYRPYYMNDDTAHPLTYMKNALDRDSPLMTLQDLSYEDIIIFYTKEDVKKLEEQKKKKP